MVWWWKGRREASTNQVSVWLENLRGFSKFRKLSYIDSLRIKTLVCWVNDCSKPNPCERLRFHCVFNTQLFSPQWGRGLVLNILLSLEWDSSCVSALDRPRVACSDKYHFRFIVNASRRMSENPLIRRENISAHDREPKCEWSEHFCLNLSRTVQTDLILFKLVKEWVRILSYPKREYLSSWPRTKMWVKRAFGSYLSQTVQTDLTCLNQSKNEWDSSHIRRENISAHDRESNVSEASIWL